MKGNELFVALDLGSSSVTLMAASKDSEGKLHIEGFVSCPSEGVISGEIHNIDLVSKSITAAVDELARQTGVKISEVYTGISGRHIRSARDTYYVYVGNGEIIQEDVRRLTDSMRNVPAPEGMRIMHMSAQGYMVNDRPEVVNPVGEFGNKLEGTFNFVLAESEYVDRMAKAMERVGLRQKGLFVNALAAAAAVLLPEEREQGAAVVELGAETTDVCIWLGGTVRYVGVIPMGSDAINKDIRSYGILERYVEKLKVTYGSATPESESSEKKIKVQGRTQHDAKEVPFQTLASIIEARMKDIADYVMEEIRGSGYENRLGMGLVVTGGGAGLKNIDQFFHNYTGLEVRVASPDATVDEESKETAADYSLATVVGLLVEATTPSAGPAPFRLVERPRPAVGGTGGVTAGGARHVEPPARAGGVVQPDPVDPAGDDDDDSEGGRRKRPSGLKRWFGKFFDEVIEDEI
ncbi:MAG: cell division protein FtsA [Rikenellaceae bacterium]|jgi:cell division protein FtsA|nr:cell division protein FtsA [Rikenellaceae bacterium]